MVKNTAIIFANGEPCSYELTSELLCTHSNAIKVVLDGAIAYVNTYSFMPDFWIGDLDHKLDTSDILKMYPQIKIIHTPDQNYTDLEKALYWLQEQKIQHVHILWATGKRLDHTLNNVVCIARFNVVFESITLYDDYSVCFPLHKTFEGYFSKGTVMSLIPLGKVEGITTQNLKYSLNDENLVLGYRNGNSNEVLQDGVVRISYVRGDMLMILNRKRI
ncbi:MAG: thiamine diphosphokinase [Bacteroidia bacterium]|nr:thiamine diphosphokinase [Bacteroidia bacterium]MDW8347674.1 thiamine diphosphokinase [Bacteroidia bacterium]